MKALSEQELHNLAMNIVGKQLEENGFEFMAVNSQLKKNPQFVCLKDKKLHFVVVKCISYPDDPRKFDLSSFDKIKDHALKFEAETFFAGVGLVNAKDYEKPVYLNEDYVVDYEGLIKL
ncbi:Na(+)-translocating NADH-quinone reductase subunit F [Cellulophaga baltica]|uniref:Na(+)-translocating NADH-quinone reductase subunit F n=1 Tax=Cellulophaga TaxID=104264 RepID=UPI001C074ACE|nr:MULTISPECIES: Na(+)-translocating NADH-quinone reductase subunit F [Cellulophaga]MBU2995028.1 Na(+)-translocating NADH-quinone reductase subunit F [Cellulophaga baltica]MDO6766423.1 Na(+)-translocating NADH-quinone reductase subunit F [Cellulophaga sp. 1_MG-2023]